MSGAQPAALLQQLLDRLRSMERVAVALSGGVDSSTLLAAAVQALAADRVTALTVESIGFTAADQRAAAAVVAHLGVPHHLIRTDTLAIEAVRLNARDRCYHCKLDIFRRLLQHCQEQRLGQLIDGTNHDDLGAFRPGLDALRSLMISSPLAELGLGKAEVRAIAVLLQLPVADRPSSACLLTRLPYGVEVTAERLQRIDLAEQALRRHGAGQVRVRDHGELARIEVDDDELALVLANRKEISESLRTLGWRWVALDLQGYRGGTFD